MENIRLLFDGFQTFVEFLSQSDQYTAWLRVCSYAVITSVMYWRYKTNKTWPYFRLLLTVVFGCLSLGTFTVAIDRPDITVAVRVLQTPIIVSTALISVYYMQQTRRREAVHDRLTTSHQAEGYTPGH
jgi:uncharacterized membrane protein